jgi:hypothetical protein
LDCVLAKIRLLAEEQGIPSPLDLWWFWNILNEYDTIICSIVGLKYVVHSL